MEISLRYHKHSYACVYASGAYGREPQLNVCLTRIYQGRYVNNSGYDLDPDEADQLADMLHNSAAQARASVAERDQFLAACDKAIAENGPGTAPSFTKWREINRLCAAQAED